MWEGKGWAAPQDLEGLDRSGETTEARSTDEARETVSKNTSTHAFTWVLRRNFRVVRKQLGPLDTSLPMDYPIVHKNDQTRVH